MFGFLIDLFKQKTPTAPPITSETSINFELQDVGPFMTVMTNHPRFGLPPDFASTIADALPRLGPDQSQRWKIDGDFDGRPMALEIEVVMDGTAAADVFFFSSKPVIDVMDAELTDFSSASGK